MSNILDQINALKAEGKKGKAKAIPQDPTMQQKIKTAIEKRPQAPAELQAEASMAAALIVDIAPKVQAIQEVTTPEQFAMLDRFLGIIEAERKKWRASVEKILIPMREAKEAVHEQDHMIDDPRANLVLQIKEKMDRWNYKLLMAKREEERLIEEEKRKLEDQAKEAERKAQAAKAAPLKSRLMAQAEQLRGTAHAVSQIKPTTELQAGENSHARTAWKWKLTDMKALVDAVADGSLPLDILDLNSVKVNQYFKKDQKEVEEWPGIEVYEDVSTARGRAWREE